MEINMTYMRQLFIQNGGILRVEETGKRREQIENSRKVKIGQESLDNNLVKQFLRGSYVRTSCEE